MYVDEVELNGWSIHIPSDGSDIGGVDPVNYGMRLVPGKNQRLLLWTSGAKTPGYPAWMAYPPVPRLILPGTHVTLCYRVMADSGTAAGENAFETDLLLVADNQKLNGSFQRLASGELEDNNWTDTTLRVGSLTPNVWHDVRINYSFNLGKTISVLSYEIDGVVWSIPAKFQTLPGKPCTWTPGAYIQIQLSSLPTALSWSVLLKKIRLEWSV